MLRGRTTRSMTPGENVMTMLHRAGLLALLIAFAAAPALAQDAAEPATATTEATEATDAAQATAAEAAPAAEAATAAAPAEAAATPEAAPAADAAPATGRIIFFRPKKFAGAALMFKIREGEEVIGMLKSGSYFIADVAPGTHVYAARSEAKDELTLEVEAGETYYVMATVQMGVLAGRPNLSPSDEAAYQEASKKKLEDMTGRKGRSK